MNRRTLRQVLECGNGACDIAAFGLKQALSDRIAPMQLTYAKAVISLRSAPHPKTLARGTPVHGNKTFSIKSITLTDEPCHDTGKAALLCRLDHRVATCLLRYSHEHRHDSHYRR